MAKDWRARTRLLLGDGAIERLERSAVAVVGLGGVGGACAEALARAGVGTLILMDHDDVDVTNLNRQLFATCETVGLSKTEAACRRLRAINPQANLLPLAQFYSAQTREELFALSPDVVVDAIDTVTAKLDLAVSCRERGIPLIECLGTGNRLDPTQFRVGRIEDTAGCGCGLARVMRRELKRRGIGGQTVLYSTETPREVIAGSENGRHPPASLSVCPPAAGCAIAGWVIRQLTGE